MSAFDPKRTLEPCETNARTVVLWPYYANARSTAAMAWIVVVAKSGTALSLPTREA